MNELEKAAREYADGLRSADKKNIYDNIEVDSSRMVAFKRGAEWQAKQSPWISVAERLPEDCYENAALHQTIVLLDDGRVDVATRVSMTQGNDWFWDKNFCINHRRPTPEVTHWMSIPE